MIAISSALIPVFLLIVAGWLLRILAGFEEPFWSATEALVFRLFLPALLLTTTWSAPLEGFRIVPLATALVGAVLLTAAMAMLVRRWLRIDDAGFSSVFQGAIRTNVYVGLAAAGALYGDAGLALTGIVVLVVITTVNVLSVLALAIYAAGPAIDGRSAKVALVGNPLIIACLAGFTFNALGLTPAGFLFDTLDIVSRAALPLGLLCVGAGLELRELDRHPRAMLTAAALKLLFMPSATAVFCWMLRIEGLTAAAAVLFNAVPISASSYVLARNMGGDARLVFRDDHADHAGRVGHHAADAGDPDLSGGTMVRSADRGRGPCHVRYQSTIEEAGQAWTSPRPAAAAGRTNSELQSASERSFGYKIASDGTRTS